MIQKTQSRAARLLDYTETLGLLEKHGINPAEGAYCTTHSEVMAKSKLLHCPWVLKVVGKSILHKTEKKLIALDLHNFEQLYHAATRLKQNVREAGLNHGDWGFLLQSELKGVELIIGGKEDPVFGKTVLFGSGGTTVELFKDFSTRVCPITRKDALDMLAETKAHAYFTPSGFRGRHANKQKMVELLLKTCALMRAEKDIESIDFNPVMSDEKNVWVVDAKITKKTPGEGS